MFMEYLIYFVLVLVGLAWNELFLYFLFGIMSLYVLTKEKCELSTKFLVICIFSVILPDNYIPEFCFILYFVIKIFIDRIIINSKYLIILFFFLFITFLSIILNSVPIINSIFSFVTFFPLFIFLFLINRRKNKLSFNYTQYIDKVFFIEFISVPINFILFSNILGDDWSKGTFGIGGGQQAQLFIIAIYMYIYYLHQYIYKKKSKKSIIKAILSLIIAISTNSWLLLGTFILSSILIYLGTLTRKKIIIISLIILFIPLSMNVALNILPDSILLTVNRIITDADYLDYRFHKITTYKETFIEIPRSDLSFALIGNGLGYYNSRAALICTGEYVDFYSKLFRTSISQYTNDFIYDYVKLAHKYGDSDYGSVLARPYSSIMALMGECGYLGLMLLILLFYYFLKKKNLFIKYLIITWLCFCLVENYFEYPKVLIILYGSVLAISQFHMTTIAKNNNDQ